MATTQVTTTPLMRQSHGVRGSLTLQTESNSISATPTPRPLRNITVYKLIHSSDFKLNPTYVQHWLGDYVA